MITGDEFEFHVTTQQTYLTSKEGEPSGSRKVVLWVIRIQLVIVGL